MESIYQMSTHNWGGSAGGGGFEFQASVSALCMAHMACGTALGWTDSGDDIPLSVSVETGGAGDDISLTLANGSVEIQAKLRARNTEDQLWQPLIKLCRYASIDATSNGVLAIGPASSNGIRVELARDIIRIGQGRLDDLSSLAITLIEKLQNASIPISACARVRIQTIHVLQQDGASAISAVANLTHICNQPTLAWERLNAEGLRLIKLRGRQDTASIAKIIPELRDSGTIGPAVIATKLLDWTLRTTAAFTIPAWKKEFAVDNDWIKLKAQSHTKSEISLDSLEAALTHYHKGSSLPHQTEFDAETLGYFVRNCVVVAGPGMGKSLLLRRISRLLARKGEPSLLVRLRPLAERMRTGDTFLEAVLQLGLDGSSLSQSDVQRIGIDNLTLLLDGMDESGDEQEEIARCANALASSHPRCRIVFATRPIGYETPLLNSWKHYELLPIGESDSITNIRRLVDSTTVVKNHEVVEATEAATSHLDYKRGVKTLSAKSPLMIALLTSLALNGVIAATTREGLYAQLFQLIERMTFVKKGAENLKSSLLNAFLQHLGWELTAQPYATAEQIMAVCANRLSKELGEPNLKARSLCDEALIFWEKTGIVERVRFRINEALTFVHKTFGEYAAAQYLVSRSDSERANLLLAIESEQKWNEVLIFASAMGLGNELSLLALNTATPDYEGTSRLLQWVKHSKFEIEAELSDRVLIQAMSIISGPHSRQGLSLGVELVAALPNLPNQSMHPQTYRDDPQWWTSLVGWACFVKLNPNLVDLGELIISMEIILLDSDTRTANGGFDLYRADGQLLDELLLSATQEAVRRELGVDEQDFIDWMKASIDTHSIGFIGEFTRILQSAGIDANFPGSEKLFSGFFDPERFEQMRKDDLELLNAILEEPPEQTELSDPPLLHLSAFWYGTELMKMEISALYDAAGDSGKSEAIEIIRMAARHFSYDYNQLIAETETEIRSAEDEHRLWENLLCVDAPMVWNGKPDSNTKPAITKALLHPSRWIVFLATNLAEHLLTTEDIAELVPEVLSKSTSQGTAGAAYLAIKFLGDIKARELIEYSHAVDHPVSSKLTIRYQ
jgi:hypothetical protein